MTKIDAVNTAMAHAPYFALSPAQISQLRAQTTTKDTAKSAA